MLKSLGTHGKVFNIIRQNGFTFQKHYFGYSRVKETDLEGDSVTRQMKGDSGLNQGMGSKDREKLTLGRIKEMQHAGSDGRLTIGGEGEEEKVTFRYLTWVTVIWLGWCGK